LVFLGQPLTPGFQVIDPAGDRKNITTEGLHGEVRLPAVIAQRAHGNRMPLRRALVAVKQRCGDSVVPIGENIGLYSHAFPDGAFGGETTAVDLRCDALDTDSDFTHRRSAPDFSVRRSWPATYAPAVRAGARKPRLLRSENHRAQRRKTQ